MQHWLQRIDEELHAMDPSQHANFGHIACVRLREGQDELRAQAEAYNWIFNSFHINVNDACEEEHQRFKQELRAHFNELGYTNYKDHPQYSFTVGARFWIQLPADFSFDDYEFRSRKRVKLMPLDEDDEREMNSDEVESFDGFEGW
jgi:hypothetical protein